MRLMTTETKRRINSAILAHIQKMVNKNKAVTPGDVFQSIGAEFGTPEKPHPVNRRTVERIVKEIKDLDQSGPWDPQDMSGQDARLVLETMGALCRHSANSARQGHVTRAEAKQILWIRKAAPTLPAVDAFNLARVYILKLADPAGVDWYLAMRPWESPELEAAYLEGVEHGGVPRLHPIAATTWQSLRVAHERLWPDAVKVEYKDLRVNGEMLVWRETEETEEPEEEKTNG
jgi:hypothetical protein